MLILPRYLARGIVRPTLLAAGIMLAIIWLLQSLRFLDFVINKGLGFGTFLELTALLIPSLLTIVLPLAVFAGTAASFRYLGNESELTSLFASGWSRLWVMFPAVIIAIIATGIGYLLHLYLIPMAIGLFKDLQYELRSGQSDIVLEEGTFNQMGSLMIYLKERTGPTSFNTLLVHDTRKPSLPTTWVAQEGRLSVDALGNPQLTLLNGLQQQVRPDRVDTLQFASHTLDLQSQLTRSALAPRMMEIEEYTLPQLWHGTGSDSPKQGRRMKAEAMKRLMWPLMPLPLVVWAAAWLLCVPPRHGSNLKGLLVATAGAIGFVAAHMAARGLAESEISFFLYAQWALPVTLLLAGIFLLRRNAAA